MPGDNKHEKNEAQNSQPTEKIEKPVFQSFISKREITPISYREITNIFDKELFDEEEYSDEESDEEDENTVQVDELQKILSSRRPAERKADMLRAVADFASFEINENDADELKLGELLIKFQQEVDRLFQISKDDIVRKVPLITELMHRLHFFTENREHPSNKWKEGTNALRCKYLVENIDPSPESRLSHLVKRMFRRSAQNQQEKAQTASLTISSNKRTL